MVKEKKEKAQIKKKTELKPKKEEHKAAKPKLAAKLKQKALAPKVKKVAVPKKKALGKAKEKPAVLPVEKLQVAKPAAVQEAPKETKIITPQPPKPQTVKPEVTKIEPAKPEAVKPVPVKPEAPKPEIQKPEPAVVKEPQPKEEVKAPAQKEEIKPEAQAVQLKEIELEFPITVKDLSIKLQEKPSVIIKDLMGMRIMMGINQAMEESTAEKICAKYNFKINKAPSKEEIALRIHQEEDKPADLLFRAPIVTFMGHVDHGKTSLLDAIRKTKVAESEHGGITQHIGAYRVALSTGEITFLDTPGHEAFTAMRARGARITDIVVLVVAADDGIMPQTQEAIDHAKAAGVPIIVAANKIDKPGANLDRVKKQLQDIDLKPEDWGGSTITVPVSAKTGEGIDNLLEMILLEAQMLELKANPKRLARGVVVEAKMEKGRGPVVTLLVQNGTLRLNQTIVVGNFYGKIKAMFNDRRQSVAESGPSCPVEVLGITGVPAAGEQFYCIEDEKQAKELIELRQEKEKQAQMKQVKRVSLEDLHAQIELGKIKELKLIIKADVQGSIEAIKDTLEKLNVSEIKLNIIHAGVGTINSSDVVLAMASDALVVGFNVEADTLAKEMASKEGVEIKIYNIIYELANEIKLAIEGMLEPKLKRVFLGRADVRKMFKLSHSGIIAGCFVTKGKINRNSLVSLIRNGAVVFEGKLSSLKRFKDDVRDVAEGFECGMAIAGFDALQEGDVIEAYEIERIARKL